MLDLNFTEISFYECVCVGDPASITVNSNLSRVWSLKFAVFSSCKSHTRKRERSKEDGGESARSPRQIKSSALRSDETMDPRPGRGRSQDRCQPSVPLRSWNRRTRLVVDVWSRRATRLQFHRLFVPRLRLDHRHRISQQRRRHEVADLLGGFRRVLRRGILRRLYSRMVPPVLALEVHLHDMAHDPHRLQRFGNHLQQNREAVLSQNT